jgi:hypothetical protein
MKQLDPLFVIRLLALFIGGLCLLYTTCVHGYHFGPGLSSPVDLHVDIKEAYEEKMKKEEEKEYSSKDYETHSSYQNDVGYCSDHGRDYN